MVLPIAVEDVKREVEILKALSGHENVVQFYNAFDDDDFVYIVVELVTLSLSSFLSSPLFYSHFSLRFESL